MRSNASRRMGRPLVRDARLRLSYTGLFTMRPGEVLRRDYKFSSVVPARAGTTAENGGDAAPHAPGGGGRNVTSWRAESATTSFGFWSFIEWIAQNRSYSRRVGDTQKKHFTVWSD